MRIKPFIISSISVPSPHSLISNITLRLKNYRLCGSIDFASMADLRDEHGNPIQLTDQHGNPVQLTDEHGNPMHLTGVASTHPITTTTAPVHDADALKTTGESHPPTSGHGIADQAVHGGAPVAAELAEGGGGEVHHEKHESSSSSSSSEDDGQGGRRKKGLKEKIKEKLTGGKHKEEQGHAPTTGVATTTTTTTTTGSATTPVTVQHHHEQHEKKGMLEKIKDKLPGHHTSH